MKNLKNILIISIIALTTLFVTACSNSSLSKEEVINKFYENNANIKNLDAKSDITMKMSQGSESMEMKSTMDSTMFIDPISLKMNLNTSVMNQSINMQMYLVDNILYVHSPTLGENKWIKTTDTTKVIGDISSKKFIENSKQTIDVLKKNIDKINLEEKDGNYVITFSGNGQEFLDIALNSLSQSSGNADIINSLKNNVKIKNMTVKYVVSKDKLLPVESDVTIDMEVSENNNTGNVTNNVKTYYSNINSAKAITLPEEAKNAVDANN